MAPTVSLLKSVDIEASIEFDSISARTGSSVTIVDLFKFSGGIEINGASALNADITVDPALASIQTTDASTPFQVSTKLLFTDPEFQGNNASGLFTDFVDITFDTDVIVASGKKIDGGRNWSINDSKNYLTLKGPVGLSGESQVVMSPSESGDYFTGITYDSTSTTNFTLGQPLSLSDDPLAISNGTNELFGVYAGQLNAGTGTQVRVGIKGILKKSDWSSVTDEGLAGLTPDAVYYVGSSGKLTIAKPVDFGYVKEVGIAVSTTVLYVDVQRAYRAVDEKQGFLAFGKTGESGSIYIKNAAGDWYKYEPDPQGDLTHTQVSTPPGY